jgi:hypothetical protein
METAPPTTNQSFVINTGPFTVITLSDPGKFAAESISGNVEFVFPAPGVYYIDSRPSSTASAGHLPPHNTVRLYSLIPMDNEIQVAYFDRFTDVIDLTRFPNILSMDDLSYSSSPLTILLSGSSYQSGRSKGSLIQAGEFDVASASSSPVSSTQQSITLLNINELKALSSHNFMFATPSRSRGTATRTQAVISLCLIIAGSVIAVLLTVTDRKDEKDNDRTHAEDDDYDKDSISGIVSISLSQSSSDRDDSSFINYLVGLLSHPPDEDDDALDSLDDDDLFSHDSLISDDNLSESSSVSSRSVDHLEDELNDDSLDSLFFPVEED